MELDSKPKMLKKSLTHLQDYIQRTNMRLQDLVLRFVVKIVERHKGVIYAKGIKGEGATFHILFPE